MRKTSSPPLFQRVQGTTINSFADEVVLSKARFLHEGQVNPDGADGPVYHGSLLLSMDAASLFPRVEQPLRQCEALMSFLQRSLLFRMKLLRLARLETELRCAPFQLGEMMTELEFKIERGQLLIDIDIIGSAVAAMGGEVEEQF